MKLTEKEFELINRILLDEFAPLNGGTPETFEDTGPVWAFVLESKADGGVFSSLTKKGLAELIADDPDDQVWVTEEGFAAWQTHGVTGSDEPVTTEEIEKHFTKGTIPGWELDTDGELGTVFFNKGFITAEVEVGPRQIDFAIFLDGCPIATATCYTPFTGSVAEYFEQVASQLATIEQTYA